MSLEKSTIAITGSTEKNFGLVFATVFLLIGLYGLYASGTIQWWSFLLSFALAVISFVQPSLLKYPNLWWFKFGLFLGSIVAPIVMALVYITTMVPIGLIMRLAGKDLLHLKINKAADSYWIKRDTPLQPMKNQF